MGRLIAWAFAALVCMVPAMAQSPVDERDRLIRELRDRVFQMKSEPVGMSALVTLEFAQGLYQVAPYIVEARLQLVFLEDQVIADYAEIQQPLAPFFDEQPETITIEQMAAKIPVTRKALKIDAGMARRRLDELLRLLEKYPRELKKRIDTATIQLDGGTYKISIETFGSTMSIEIWDELVRSDRLTGDSAIVRWANRMRLDLTQ